MQSHIQTLVKHLFDKESFEQVTVQELKQFTDAYPYAAVGQFLYAKKLYDARSWNYYEQTEQASLYFHNPLWFRWIMDLKYEATVTVTVPKKEEPVAQPIEEAPAQQQSAYRVVVQMPKGVVPAVVPESIVADTETVLLSAKTVEPLSDLLEGILPTPVADAVQPVAEEPAINNLHEYQGTPTSAPIEGAAEAFGDIQAAEAPVQEYTEAVTNNTDDQPQPLDTANIYEANGIPAAQEEVATTPEFFAEAAAAPDVEASERPQTTEEEFNHATMMAAIAEAIGEGPWPQDEQAVSTVSPEQPDTLHTEQLSQTTEAAGKTWPEDQSAHDTGAFGQTEELAAAISTEAPTPTEELPPVEEQSAEATVQAAWPEDQSTNDTGAFGQTEGHTEDTGALVQTEALTEDIGALGQTEELAAAISTEAPTSTDELPPVEEQSAEAIAQAWPEDQSTNDTGAFGQTEGHTEDTGASAQTDSGALGQTEELAAAISTEAPTSMEELPPVEEQSAEATVQATWPEDQSTNDTGAFGQTEGHTEDTGALAQTEAHTEDSGTLGQTEELAAAISTEAATPTEELPPVEEQSAEATVQAAWPEDQHTTDTGAFGQSQENIPAELDQEEVVHSGSDLPPYHIVDDNTAEINAEYPAITPEPEYSEHVNVNTLTPEEFVSQEETPAVDQPVAEEAFTVDQPTAEEGSPAVEQTLSTEQMPALEEAPAKEETPVAEYTPAAEEAPVQEETPAGTPTEEQQEQQPEILAEQPAQEHQPAQQAAIPSIAVFMPASLEPKATVDTEEPIFESYHTIDYFASQGIKLQQEDYKDRLGKQLKTFSEWLRSMKRIVPTEATASLDDITNQSIQRIAEHSVEEKEILTEAMAEVWAKQGNREKAISIYEKLSLLNPAKSPYFAGKIEQLKA